MWWRLFERQVVESAAAVATALVVSMLWFSIPAIGQIELSTCPDGTSVTWNNCQGASALPGGVKYVGNWHDGKPNGRGSATFPNGQKYVGEFHDGVRSGQGVFMALNGEKYAGEFRDGKANGQGVVTFSDGARYEGEFHDGKIDGRGIEYLSNGSVRRIGLWSSGQFVTSTAVPPTVSHPGTVPSPLNRTEVALVREAGTFKVPVLINGVIPLNFTVDSGASDVSIPADVVLVMIRTGTLRESDFLGTQNYRLADGSVIPSRTFRIRTLKVGDRVIENVTGSMSGVEGVLLLGQSFLTRFHRWSINNSKEVLELE
jgi:hypothetical protein